MFVGSLAKLAQRLSDISFWLHCTSKRRPIAHDQAISDRSRAGLDWRLVETGRRLCADSRWRSRRDDANTRRGIRRRSPLETRIGGNRDCCHSFLGFDLGDAPDIFVGFGGRTTARHHQRRRANGSCRNQSWHCRSQRNVGTRRTEFAILCCRKRAGM
jgi:hypothetical protein